MIADWTTESGGNFLTATKYGVSQFSGFLPSVQVVDNAASYPLVHTLPAVIGQGAVPRILTAGATLGSDTFTDTNGVRLNASIRPRRAAPGPSRSAPGRSRATERV
jgi:hypothetical protein